MVNENLLEEYARALYNVDGDLDAYRETRRRLLEECVSKIQIDERETTNENRLTKWRADSLVDFLEFFIPSEFNTPEGRRFIVDFMTLMNERDEKRRLDYAASYKPLTILVPLMGGKVSIRKSILPIIDRYPRRVYVEPFGGMGGLFFGKKPEPKEVYNDGQVMFTTLFRAIRDPVMRSEVEEILYLIPQGRYAWYETRDLCRKWHNEQNVVLDTKWNTLCPEKSFADLKADANLNAYSDEAVAAAAFFFCQINSYNGKLLTAYNNGAATLRDKTSVLWSRRANLRAYTKRLEGVVIENLDYADCIAKYDDEDAFFFLDPPYNTENISNTNTSKEYKTGWSADREVELVDTLLYLKGNFVLSCYDNDNFRRLDAICDKETIETRVRIGQVHARKPRTETVYYSKQGLEKEPVAAVAKKRDFNENYNCDFLSLIGERYE